jgi:hypothetical protein
MRSIRGAPLMIKTKQGTNVAWLVPVAVLVAIGRLIGDLAGFYTVAALVTFGAVYAVVT